MNTKDLFSGHANQYAAFRPDYPQSLFDFIYLQVKEFGVAWDCATGNGQAAKELAKAFKHVYATDISQKQLDSASRAANIIYTVSAAEKSNFANNTLDLITVAQAAHWFRFEEFYAEVNRVAKPDCVLAIWGYGLLQVNPEFDAQLIKFYKDVVGPYWDPERKFIDTAYQTIPFPFRSIPVPEFFFSKKWNADFLQGYLNTWSAVQKYKQANGNDPVGDFMTTARDAYGQGEQVVNFPLFLRLGIIDK